MNDFEVRGHKNAMYRGVEDFTLSGYASMFDTWASIGGQFDERVMPGAFAKTLAEDDQVALWNHEDRYPLARRSAGSLELHEDSQGLHTLIRLDPKISYHNDLWQGVKNGTIRNMSFRFSVEPDGEEYTRDKSGRAKRTIHEARLFEVSPVTFPAYESTSISARAQRRVHEVSHPDLILRVQRLRLFADALRNI